jgi:epoxyqueuosine reductase QueG
MPKITSGVLKRWAKEMGADIVGIASVDRFGGAPPGHDPRDFVPEAESVIVAGIRIPEPIVDYDRYHLKFQETPQDIAAAASVENLYMLMGHYTLDMMLNSLAVRIANKLEVEGGYKSFPTPNTSHTGLGHSVDGLLLQFFSQRHAATRAGLGEFGFNNIVLTPEFGPRVRFVSIITEAELEPNPLITEKICLREKCGGRGGPICLRMCTPGAIQLRKGLDHDAIFIDTPSKTAKPLCIKRIGDKTVYQCVYTGTCMRVCPIKLNLKKVRTDKKRKKNNINTYIPLSLKERGKRRLAGGKSGSI